MVDYENLVAVEGVAVANSVRNREEVVGWGKEKEIVTWITWNDGSFDPFLLVLGDMIRKTLERSMGFSYFRPILEPSQAAG